MKKVLLIFGFIVASLASFMAINNITSQPAYADVKSAIQSGVNATGTKTENQDLGTLIAQIIKTLLFIIGVLSVIVIIFAGVLFVTSAGNSSTVSKAKSTIIYAVVGLIVAMTAYMIVDFVIKSFSK